jgi:autotransporter translocation and assembly factor TamB
MRSSLEKIKPFFTWSEKLQGRFITKAELSIKNGEISAKGKIKLINGKIKAINIPYLSLPFEVKRKRFEFKEATITTRQGKIVLSGNLSLQSDLPLKVNLKFHQLDIHSIYAKDIPQAFVSGTLSLEGRIKSPLRLKGNIALQVQDLKFNQAYKKRLKFALNSRFEIRKRHISLRSFKIVSGRSNITLQGDLIPRQRLALDFRAKTFDFRKINMFLNPNLFGYATLKGRLYGPWRNPTLKAKGSIKEAKFDKIPLGDINLDFETRGDVFKIHSLNGKREDYSYLIKEALLKFSRGKVKEFVAEVKTNKVPLKYIQTILNQSLPGEPQGRLDSQIKINKTQEDLELEGKLKIFAFTFFNQSFSKVEITGLFSRQVLKIEEIRLFKKGGGEVVLKGILDSEGKIEAQMDIKALNLSAVRSSFLKTLQTKGRIQGRIKVSGSRKNPNIEGKIRLKYSSIYGIKLRHPWIKVSLKDRVLNLKGNIIKDEISFQGSIKLKDTFPFQFLFVLKGLDIKRFIPFSELKREVFFIGDGVIRLKGNLSPMSLKGRLEFARVWLSFKGYTLLNLGPITVRFTHREFKIEQARFIAQRSKFIFQGKGKRSGFNFRLRGDIDLGILKIFKEVVAEAAGILRVDLSLLGPWNNPIFIGKAVLKDASVRFLDFPQELQGFSGKIVFGRSRFIFEEFQGSVGGGRVWVWGKITLKRGKSSFKFTAQLDKVGLRFPSQLPSIISGVLKFESRDKLLPLLSGRLRISELRYLRTFRVEQTIEDLTRQLSKVKVETYDPRQDLFEIDLRLYAKKNLKISNPLIKAEFRIDDREPFKVVGTNQRVGILGILSAIKGSIIWRHGKFKVIRGILDFDDPHHPSPKLDILAETWVRKWRIFLHIIGPHNNFRIFATSNPPLPSGDIFLLLAIGSTREEIKEAKGYGEASLDLLSKVTGIESKLQEVIPLVDEIRIKSEYSSRSGRIEPRVFVEKKFSPKMRVNASSSLSDTRDFKATGEFFILKVLSAQIVYDNDREAQYGNFGVNLKWRIEF